MPRVKELLGGDVTTHFRDLTFRWQTNLVDVEFSNGRLQTIRYQLDGDHYMFVSKVASRDTVARIGRSVVAKEILLRNRTAEVVRFGFGPGDAVEGCVEARAQTLQNRELRYYLAQLARECDRFQYWLSASDDPDS